MAKQYLHSIDLTKNELQNARIHNLASDPSSPVDGQIYYNTTSKRLRSYNSAGTAWIEYGDASAAGDVTQSSNSGGAGRMKVSAGANKAITDLSGVVGIIKTDTNGVVSAAAAGTDYQAALTGTGFVKSTGGTISYDNSTYLTTASAASTYQPLDSDLTTIAGLTATTNNFMVAVSSAWASVTPATARTALGGTTVGQNIFTSTNPSAITFLKVAADNTVSYENAATHRTSIGATTVGSNLFTLTNPSAIRFIKINADNTVTAEDASTFRTSIGAGVGDVTASSTTTFTNKTFDANGTGNSISNIETADFAANVIDTDATLAANSNTRIASQAAVKGYVDATVQGAKWKNSVRAASTAAGTLATSFENGDSFGGVTLATGDRILLKDQAAGAENGIYTVNASGAPTRATDADTAAEILGMVVNVREGTLADTAWILTNDSITLGTTALVYTDFITANVPSASTSLQGKVELATQAEAEAKSSSTLAVTPASLATFTRKATATIGDGVTTAIAVTDNLGTADKIARIRFAADDKEAECEVTYATNTTTFTFASAPAASAIKVVIIG